MSSNGIISALIALALLFLLFAAVPFIITIIYKHFYNNHVNQSLQSEVPLRRWLSPIGLFGLLLAAEVIVVIVGGMLFQFNPNSGTMLNGEEGVSVDEQFRVMSQSEMGASALKALDGRQAEGELVDGYLVSDLSQGNISCLFYDNQSEDLLPACVVRLEYAGTDMVGSWDVNLSYTQGGWAAMGDMTEMENGPIYVVLGSQAGDRSDLKLTCEFYEDELDAYSTGALGTYDMPEPSAVLEVDLQ